MRRVCGQRPVALLAANAERSVTNKCPSVANAELVVANVTGLSRQIWSIVDLPLMRTLGIMRPPKSGRSPLLLIAEHIQRCRHLRTTAIPHQGVVAAWKTPPSHLSPVGRVSRISPDRIPGDACCSVPPLCRKLLHLASPTHLSPGFLSRLAGRDQKPHGLPRLPVLLGAGLCCLTHLPDGHVNTDPGPRFNLLFQGDESNVMSA